jgi:hypothetical protein
MRRIQMSIERVDVAFTGPLRSRTQDSQGDMFTISAKLSHSNVLSWFCYSVTTNRILLSSGLLGSGIVGDINGDIRPVYFRYSNVGEDMYTFYCYSDILANNYLGTLGVDSNPRFLYIVDPRYGATPISFTAITPSSYTNPSFLLVGVKYWIESNIYISSIPSYAGQNQLEGISQGFNIPITPPEYSIISQPQFLNDLYNRMMISLREIQLMNMTIYDDFEIQFCPVRVYDPERTCTQVNSTIGYLPHTMVTSQCILLPDTPFSKSSYCTSSYTGLTTSEECSSIGFLYYYAQNQCGESYNWVNFLGDDEYVQTSIGAGCSDGMTCKLQNSRFLCLTVPQLQDDSSTQQRQLQDDSPTQQRQLQDDSPTQQRQLQDDSSTQSRSEREIKYINIGILIILVAIILVILILIVITYIVRNS